MIKKFISITKPGIIFGNLITVAGGFGLASQGKYNLSLFLATLIGISLVIAAGCVFNNVIDRDIDSLMERTKNRVMVKGHLSAKVALFYGFILSLLGVFFLYHWANWLTVLVALIGLFFYVVVYSLWFKRNSIYGTLIGSISGSIPPVVGYCSVSNKFDLGALILFVLLSVWQMPHSYAIAIFRFNDYSSAGIPVLPVKKGIQVAKRNMLLYVVIFTVVSSLLSLCGYTGKYYLIVALAVGLWWIRLAASGFRAKSNDISWARKMFGFSIIAIMLLSLMMALNSTVLLSAL